MALEDLFPYQVQKAPDRPLCHLVSSLADVVGIGSALCRLQLPPFPHLSRISERPAAVQGARFLRGAANPGRRGPFWNVGGEGKGARPTHQTRPAQGIDTVGCYAARPTLPAQVCWQARQSPRFGESGQAIALTSGLVN